MILECPSCHARFKVADSAIPPEGRTVRCSKCAHQWHVDKTSGVVEAPVAAASNDMGFDPEQAAAEVRAAMGKPSQVPMDNDDLSPEARAEGEAFLSQLEAAINATEAQDQQRKPRPAATTEKPRANKPKRPALDPKPFKIAVPVIALVWVITAFITYFPAGMSLPGLSGLYRAVGAAPTDGLVFADVTMEKEKLEGGKTKYILSGSISNHSNVERDVPTVRVTLRDAKGETVWGRKYPVNTTLKPGEVYPFKINNVETSFGSSVKLIKVDLGNTLQLMVR